MTKQMIKKTSWIVAFWRNSRENFLVRNLFTDRETELVEKKQNAHDYKSSISIVSI